MNGNHNQHNQPPLTLIQAIDRINEVRFQIHTLLHKIEEQDGFPVEEDQDTFHQIALARQNAINETQYYNLDEHFFPYLDLINEEFDELEETMNPGVNAIHQNQDPGQPAPYNPQLNGANNPPLPANEDPAFPANGGRRKIKKSKKSKKAKKSKKTKKRSATKKTKGRKH